MYNIVKTSLTAKHFSCCWNGVAANNIFLVGQVVDFRDHLHPLQFQHLNAGGNRLWRGILKDALTSIYHSVMRQ